MASARWQSSDRTETARAGVAVIVLSWNGRDDTLEGLDSLRRTGSDEAPAVVILVDNGSSDGTVSAVAERYPEVEILPLDRNLGFAAGNNRGAALALERGVRYLFFLNNDAVILPGCLRELTLAMEDDRRLGVLAPLTYHYATGRVVPTAHRVDFWTGRVADVPPPNDGADRAIEADYVWGCGMMVRADLWKALGGFDTRYFAYFEDADLCLRARRLGYGVGLAPAALIRHKVSSTANRVFVRQTWLRARNRLLFFASHGSPLQRVTATASCLAFRLPVFLYASVRVYHGLRRAGTGKVRPEALGGGGRDPREEDARVV